MSGDSRGWVPDCDHDWVDITTYEDRGLGWNVYVCDGCGVQTKEATGEQGIPQGWRNIEMHIDRHEGRVRMTVYEQATGRTVYSALYDPDTARTMARILTFNAYRIEDENG
jgi:hypothetical protein